MATISVVLATYNEEKKLKDCLDSVEGLADEIIVVDGGSQDETVAIANQFKARVVVTNNPPIFHINKQKAIDLATKEWVLQLDADERLSDQLAQEIKHTVSEKKNQKINGYWIARKNWFLGRFLMKGGQYPDYTLRLYRRGKGWLPQKSVHEQAVVGGQTKHLKNPLIHMADISFSHYLFRFGRYTNLLANEIRRNEEKRSLFVGLKYIVFLPIEWFLLTYLRHKGFMDSWQGFIFSFFSSLRFPVAYFKSFKNI